MTARLFAILSLLLPILAGCASQPMAPAYVLDPTAPYQLDSGDQVRVVVFGQSDLTNTYTVDATGYVSMPLVGSLRARGRAPHELEQAITSALASGYLRSPSVSVEVQTHRPFYVIGEVGAPGKYPFVDELTGRRAIAIAGGFSPRAVKGEIEISRLVNGQLVEARVPLDSPIHPGDTIRVIERWF